MAGIWWNILVSSAIWDHGPVMAFAVARGLVLTILGALAPAIIAARMHPMDDAVGGLSFMSFVPSSSTFFCLPFRVLCCGSLGLSQAGSGALLSASESSATARTTFQARVEKHAEALLVTGERWPGSPGATAADAYIAEQLAAAGMQEQHSFSTPVLMQLPQGEPRLQLSGDDSDHIAVLPHVAMGGSPAGTGARGITAPLARLSTDLTSERLKLVHRCGACIGPTVVAQNG